MTVYNLDVLLPQFRTSPLFHVWFQVLLLDLQAGFSGKLVWWSHLFKNFPQFVVIYTVKGFSVVNEAEIDVFLGFSAFSVILWVLALWSLVPLPFLNPPWTFRCSWLMYCWSLAWRIFSITLLWASLVAQTVKRLSAMLETRARSLSPEDPLEKEMATHSSILAWKIPWAEEPGRLQSMGSQRVGHDWATLLTFC